jgi:hypothetical protein
MTYTDDYRVDTYIDGLPEWQQTICRESAKRWADARKLLGDDTITTPVRVPASCCCFTPSA